MFFVKQLNIFDLIKFFFLSQIMHFVSVELFLHDSISFDILRKYFSKYYVNLWIMGQTELLVLYSNTWNHLTVFKQ